jgi:hypothetical protein
MKSKRAKKAEKVIRGKKYSCITDLMIVRNGVLTHPLSQTSCACGEHTLPGQNAPGKADLFRSKIAAHLYH